MRFNLDRTLRSSAQFLMSETDYGSPAAQTKNSVCSKKNEAHPAAAVRETKQKNERNSTSRPLASALRPARFADLEIFDLATGF
jgi:hypothetical protein